MAYTKEDLFQFVEAGLTSSLKEASNAIGADANEILTMLFLIEGDWSRCGNAEEAQNTLEARKKVLPPETYSDQSGRAKMMAQKIFEWANANGYEGRVVKAYWTARPNVLSKAVGQPVDSRKNPTDILLVFRDGRFLGISAKSTKKVSGGIGFKNAGLGTLSKTLNINLPDQITQMEKEASEKLHVKGTMLSDVGKAIRKQLIRSNHEVQLQANQFGARILNVIRDTILERYKTMSQEELRNHFTSVWMNADNVFPPWIKCTGHGSNGKYSASIEEPNKNDTIELLNSGELRVSPTGNATLVISGNGKKLFLIRAKWESQALASALKFSAEP